MPWGPVAGAVASYALSSSGGSGGGSTQQQTATNTKEPWAAAQPWLLQQLQQGQGIQAGLTAQPFSPAQQAAYGNAAGQSDYLHRLIPSLLGQLQGQQVGFDRSNPTAKPKAWDWGGLASPGTPNVGASSLQAAMQQAMAARPQPQAAQPSAGSGQFTMPSENFLDPTQAGARWTPEQAGRVNTALGSTGGGYGSYRVGMQPDRGTQAWADMQIYNQIMGLNKQQQLGYGLLGNGGNNSGNSIGGSPSADGSGGGAPGPW